MYSLFLRLYMFFLVEMVNGRVEEIMQAGVVPTSMLQVSFDVRVS